METRYNLFTVSHKGLRYAMQQLVFSAGRLDINNREERRSFLGHFNPIAVMLHQHAKDEDTHIQPWIERFGPDTAHELEEQHARSEALLGRLEALAAELEKSDDYASEATRIWLSFVDELNHFTGDYFLHLYHEECIAMPILWKHMDDASLVSVANKLRSEIPPHIQRCFQQFMLPALNMQERYMMLSGVKQSAPAPVFEGICRLAESVLSPVEWDELKIKLESGAA